MVKKRFNAPGVQLALLENDIVKSETWSIDVILSCGECQNLDNLKMNEMGFLDWLYQLFNQKLLAKEETELTKVVENTLYVKDFSNQYIVDIVSTIITQNIPNVNIEFIEITRI